mmetsp:Transcript_5768/g.10326  ORF Transcript_5768/g.10326 Transcript_5768/m.10326 type:complete len:134 (+) Transcript_5768:106-507(+)|eukprot:CAMPEP_0184517576 /NCGR_PEP_ID=MMETSP0198_2-20121128/5629_1 /TAXON_ID=1112570 /ORGANISM="Thraustochytrium sp., Strain LLF1b" /LENGTH=133 /DNA_ID=CAMNT_0026907959 /DNA_START=118 /DNA_END=519 /DNA_ORIENTATION=+
MMSLRVAGLGAARGAARAQVRAFGGYAQPPLTQGPGGKDGLIADDAEQATGREREELKAFAQGKEYFNRQPVQMVSGQGSFENPVLIPSELHDRIVGMIPKGQDGPIWFEVTDKAVHYVPHLDTHFKLYNPYK